MFTKSELHAFAIALDNLHQPVAIPVVGMPHVISARQKLAMMIKALEAPTDVAPPDPATPET